MLKLDLTAAPQRRLLGREGEPRVHAKAITKKEGAPWGARYRLSACYSWFIFPACNPAERGTYPEAEGQPTWAFS